MKSRPHLSPGYTFFSAGAVAAAILLTACGPDDGVAGPEVAHTAPANVTVAPVQTAAAAAPAVAPAPIAAPPAAAVRPVAAAVPRDESEPVQARRVSDVRTAQAEAAPRKQRVASATLGRVRSIEPIRTRPDGTGVGGVVGGVLGAVVGNQIGSGGGRAAATAIGAVGGAVAGNNVERNYKAGITGYRVLVEFDNGNSRTYEEEAVGNLRVGDRVSVRGGQVNRV